MSSCPEPGTIQGFVEGSLEASARGDVEHHVADCTECRQLVAALKSSMTAPTVTDGVTRPARPTPTTIGRYEIDEVLGAGGMGIVYAAHDPKLRRKVAIKLLRAGAGEGEDTREAQARLLREARAMARVHHPHVVSVFDAGEHGDEVFVAMELVHGSTLRRWLITRERTTGEIIDAFIEAGRGLAAAHAAGLVHRDFKPDNVLVGDDRRVRVTDFGLARKPGRATSAPVDRERTPATSHSMRLTATGALHGTPGYIAPEQYAHREFDARSDQFAFCVSLWEALDGKRPFRGESHDQIEAAVTSGSIAEPTERVPRAIRRVLERGLDLDPAKRWADLDELLDQLAQARPRSRRRQIAMASFAAVALTGVLVLVSTSGKRAVPPAEQPDRLARETVELTNLLAAGDRKGGTKYAEDLVARFRGDGGADFAAALLLRGFAHYFNGELTQAADVLVQSATLAERLGELRVKSMAISNLVHALEDLGKREDAARWSGMVVASAGAPSQNEISMARALESEAHRRARTDLAAGVEIYRQAASIWARVGDIVSWAANRGMVAKNFINVLQYDPGCALSAVALATVDVVRPPPSEELAVTTGFIANGGASCEAGRRRPQAAIAYAERAIAAFTGQFGPTSPYLDTPYVHLGRSLALAGDLAGSEKAFDHVLTLELTPRIRIRNLGIMVVTAAETERFDVGVKRAQMMVDLGVDAFPNNHPDQLANKVLLAKLLVKAKQFERAGPLLEELLVAYQTVDEPIMLADARFALARTLADSDTKRAMSLAEQARATYLAAGSVRAPHLKDVEAFLAAR